MSHKHDHEHGAGCCGHTHSAEHEHAHGCCGHSHGHEEKAEHACCGHDHAHGAGCCGHDHAPAEADSDAAWTHRMFMFIEMVVLLMVGGVLCYFVASGRIEGRPNGSGPYVTGWFKGLALAGGLGIIVMGVFNFLRRRHNGGCGHAHEEGDCCGHTHEGSEGSPAAPHSHDGGMGSRAVVLLLLSGSLAAGALLTPDGYSEDFTLKKGAAYDAAGRGGAAAKLDAASTAVKEAAAAGTLTLATVEKYQKRNAAGNFEMGVIQLYYLGPDPDYARVMEGQGVESTGQLVPDNVNPGEGRLRLLVMETTCCAADSRPYSIPVQVEGKTPDFVRMGWYKVTGTIAMTEERGIKVAMIKATDLTPTLRPAAQRTIF